VGIGQSVHFIDCDRLSNKMSPVKLLSELRENIIIIVNEEHYDKSLCAVSNDRGEICGVHITGMYHQYHYHAHQNIL